IIVMAAAVGDFRPSSFSKDKIKRKGEKSFILEMKQNRDIAAALGAARKPGQFLVGFAAETGNAMENAREKLEKKKLDQIVVNEVSGPEGAFGSDRNSVRILDSGGELFSSEGSKDEVAEAIWDAVAQGRKDHGQ
ncbi:MAG TPA: phosphopantothenoylcysteine decarboxylase, partial [Synergistales bacterium]|nr:phosphopantothenoylcysteine decarboxylase [Synergistales bacterium]